MCDVKGKANCAEADQRWAGFVAALQDLELFRRICNPAIIKTRTAGRGATNFKTRKYGRRIIKTILSPKLIADHQQELMGPFRFIQRTDTILGTDGKFIAARKAERHGRAGADFILGVASLETVQVLVFGLYRRGSTGVHIIGQWPRKRNAVSKSVLGF